jgi:LuxR family transcriptional regulator, maltose regulon positive regulatory protein
MTDTSAAAATSREDPLDPAPLVGSTVGPSRTQVPPSQEFAVTRPRLLARLDDGFRLPLTVVTGPAGTGKTMLVESWASSRHAELPVAWLTLGDEDDEVGTFWGHVLHTLRESLVAHGVDLADVGRPLLPGTVDRSFLQDLAARLGEAPRPFVLVLDELDRVTDERVLRQLDQVLEAAQPAMRVIALARREPRALTHRRRLRGEMALIGAPDLAFAVDETARLLAQHGLDPSSDAVNVLQQSTEGWAAGLRLCALAMREHGDRAGPTGGPWAERRLAGYLVDEVLDALPDNTRDLLTRLSVVDRVEAGLARALTDRPDVDQLLDELAGEDLFVTTDAMPRRSYRIHPLLLDVLRAELRTRGLDAVSGQHACAARWYDAHGDCARAVEHFAAAGLAQESCASVVRNLGVVELLEHRAPRALEEVLDRVPGDLDAPEVRVVRAAVDLGAHRLDRAAAQLVGLDARNLAVPSHGALRASATLSRLVLASAVSDPGGALDAWQALEPTLSTVASPQARAGARALALSALSGALLWGGDEPAFARILGAAVEAAEVEGCDHARITVRGQQALAAYRRGALRDAAQLGEEALSLGRQHGLPARHGTGVAHLALSAVALEWNDRVGSLRHLEHADLAAQAENEPVLQAVVKLLRAYHHALDGRRARALAVIADVRASAETGALPAWVADRLVVTEAMARLRCGDVDGAVTVLDADPGAAGDWLHARAAAAHADGDATRALVLLAPILTGDVPATDGIDVYALLLVARIRHEAGDAPAARRGLAEALRLARPEGRRRPFAEARVWLRPLLDQDRELARVGGWIGTVLVPRPRHGGDDVGPVLVEPLTSREKAVLELMAQVMTVADIAADLHISVNTVKTHQKSVYRKLSVSRAHDAVRRGRELELI